MVYLDGPHDTILKCDLALVDQTSPLISATVRFSPMAF